MVTNEAEHRAGFTEAGFTGHSLQSLRARWCLERLKGFRTDKTHVKNLWLPLGENTHLTRAAERQPGSCMQSGLSEASSLKSTWVIFKGFHYVCQSYSSFQQHHSLSGNLPEASAELEHVHH